MQLEGYVSNLDQNLDSKGRVYYTNELGEIVKPNISPLKALKNNLQAFGFNASRWLNETNPESEAYKQKANTLLAMETLPMGIGRAGTQMLASKLTPMFGRKIGQMTAEGIGSGLVGGGVEEIGRAMIDEEKPLDVARRGLIGAGVGAGFGGLLGYGISRIGRNIAKKNLVGNPEAQMNFYDDYIEGLNNNAVTKQGFGMNDIRGLKAGNYGNLEGETLYSLFAGEQAKNIDNLGEYDLAQTLNNMPNSNNSDIWEKTGWFKGVDGKWRYEIPDGKLKDNIDWLEHWDVNNKPLKTAKLSDVYDNPTFYEAYPYAKNIDVNISNLGDAVANYNEWGKEINLDNLYNYKKTNQEVLNKLNELKQDPLYVKAHNYDKPIEDIHKDYLEYKNSDLRRQEEALLENLSIDGWGDDALKNLQHEIQHYIQGVERFARGGSGKGNIRDYLQLAGETEARLAERRTGLADELLKKYEPFKKGKYGYDVAPTKQTLDSGYGVYGKGKVYKLKDEPLDLTDFFDGTPTEEEVRKTVQDLIDSGKIMDTADKNWKMDIQERQEIRGVPTIDHVVKSDKWKYLNDAQRRRLRKYVQQVEKIINNAKYTNKTSPNTKPYQKPDVDKYHYFETQVKVGTKTYNLLLDAEQYIGDSIKKPQTVHLYNIKEIK